MTLLLLFFSSILAHHLHYIIIIIALFAYGLLDIEGSIASRTYYVEDQCHEDHDD